MSATRPTSRQARGLLFLILCAALIGLLPVTPATAAVDYPLPVDDKTSEFGDVGSSFLFTGLVSETGEPTENAGGVQLVPVGTLDFKTTGSNIPDARDRIRAAAIGRYIFAVGGNGTGANCNAGRFCSDVYRGVVDQDTGLVAWERAGTLPAVPHTTRSGATAAEPNRSDVAIAALTTNAAEGDGFLYVIGGSVQIGIRTISSRSVLIGTVDNGVITGWRKGGDSNNNPADNNPPGEPDGLLPATYPDRFGIFNDLDRGITGASAFIMTAANGITYLYVVGGLHQDPDTGSTISVSGSRRIIYGSLNTSTGDITWISNGTPGTYFDIPQSAANEAGFWYSALISGEFANAETGELQKAFFLTGGQIDDDRINQNRYSQRVVKGIINSNGTITFANSAASGDGALLQPRDQHGAALWNNTLYIFGGRSGGTMPPDVSEHLSSSSPITTDDQRVLTTLPGTGGNFTTLADEDPPRRFAGGYVVVPSTKPGLAYVYYIGGNTGTSANPVSIVSQATVGEQPDEPTYPESGWYFAAPISIAFGGSEVKVKTIRWRATGITNGADLEVSYRTSTNPNCLVQTSYTAWTQPLDASPSGPNFSVEGANEATGFEEPANCFQYRVRFRRGTDERTTPTLTRLSIVVLRPGSADLKFVGDGITATLTNGTVTGLAITITNHNDFEQPTISADYGEGGSFFLDLFVYPPGVSVPNPHPAPPLGIEVPVTDYHRAYMSINRSRMTPDAVVRVEAYDTRWWFNTTQGGELVNPGTGLDLRALFPVPGTYTLVAVVDSVDNVQETALGAPDPLAAEKNNVSMQVQVTITTPPPPGPGTNPGNPGNPGDPGEPGNGGIYLPLILRPLP